ncbi:hypothetical protein [uncultured Parasutterella sp.]|uniref:hypothetical protein n=1 Tax=uncultured Parasutterella sp. TaxID=1263098 RepID=UPI0025B71C1E|nr:hypothetical protein [uncultured Parasutterella sp.]
MKFDLRSFINGLMKLTLMLAFFGAGFWTKSILDQHQILVNRDQIESLQIETDKQRAEIDALKEQSANIDLILEKISALEAKHK